MSKISITAIFIIIFNLVAFSLDAFNASYDLLRWSGLPPFESYLFNSGIINEDKIENIVGNKNYSGIQRKDIRYVHNQFELDCTGNRSGLIISIDENPDDYSFSYHCDLFYYSRNESFSTIGKKICKDTAKLSLILSHDQKTEQDSVMGIILF